MLNSQYLLMFKIIFSFIIIIFMNLIVKFIIISFSIIVIIIIKFNDEIAEHVIATKSTKMIFFV